MAQEPQTRAEATARERDQKAERLEPPRAGALERNLLWIENGRTFERILNPAEGFYPKIGSVTSGSGMSFGAGYRRPDLFGERTAAFSAFAFGSFRRYWLIDARVDVPRVGDSPLFFDVHAQRSDFPDEDYFGQGGQSERVNYTSYRLQRLILGGAGGVRPIGWLSLGGRADWLRPQVGAGPGDRVPSFDERFALRDIPGSLSQPDYMNYDVYAEANTREPRGNPRAGGRYRISYQRYHDVDLDRFSFNRFEVDAQQHISLLKNRRLIALHALVSSSTPDEGHQVPFYLQRTLGGPDDLRGFRRHRFRDNNLVLFQAEYRWEIFTAVDGAIFVDAGKVAARPEDIDFNDLESDYGVGVRFGTINGVFLRVEGAFGSSGGKHFIIRLANVF